MRFTPWATGRIYPGRLIVAALVLPVFLLGGLIALDYWLLEPAIPSGQRHLALLAIGAAGVIAFSVAILARLGELHAREVAQSRRLQALNTAGLALSAELDLETLLHKLADLARIVGDAKYAALGTFDAQGVVTRFYTSGIDDEERARIGHLPVGRGILGLLPRAAHPIRLHDIKDHPASVGFPKDHPPMRTFLGVPIRWRGESVGNLYLTEKQGGADFTSEDEEALLALAAQAAIAVENARLYAQTSRISTFEERHRIGMDLHDGVIQSLYGLGLLIEDAAAQVETAPKSARSQLGRAVDRLNAAIADLRNYVLGLRPVRGSDRPLHESLATLAQQIGTNALLTVDVKVEPEGESALGRLEREAVFYVAADALGNVARHARARRVQLRVVKEGDDVVLEVADDGVGFDTTETIGGLGLRNMRQRAFDIGARLDVRSMPGTGTRLLMRLPGSAEVKA
ncbi:MAG TPA: GAF domain-containing sensor histidine kinase [Candidatus Limnocylindria bacterium]|nr:GAF domain-containing sensor histidine kinase [Candidatus Limnocylindria bacterium]